MGTTEGNDVISRYFSNGLVFFLLTQRSFFGALYWQRCNRYTNVYRRNVMELLLSDKVKMPTYAKKYPQNLSHGTRILVGNYI